MVTKDNKQVIDICVLKVLEQWQKQSSKNLVHCLAVLGRDLNNDAFSALA